MKTPAPAPAPPLAGDPVWQGPLAPLNLAAYAVLALIAYNQLGAADATGIAPLLALSLCTILTCFVLADWFCGVNRRPLLARALLSGQIVAAMANLYLVYDGMNPILLVLIAAQLPFLLPLSWAVAVILALDVLLYLLLREHHGQSRPLFHVAVYATFQCFAMLTAWFAHRVELANRQLAAVNADLLATRSLLEEGARDGERLRLSRELHDVAGHTLTALQMHLELARRLPDEDLRIARVESAQRLAESLLRDIRGVVTELRRYDGVDLPAALAALCRGFPGIDVRLDIDPQLRVADVDRAEALLRTVQEALTNAVRHGLARRIEVQVLREAAQVTVRIGDDGRGVRRLEFGNGLTGMQERLQRLGGELRIDTAPGRGLHLHASLDDPPPEPA